MHQHCLVLEVKPGKEHRVLKGASSADASHVVTAEMTLQEQSNITNGKENPGARNNIEKD